jgi:hypothetical protein
MEPQELDDISLVSTEEAIAEVRRWLEVDKVDPERIFAQTGDQVIRYGDLVAHLEQETSDGKILRFAISRGRVMKSERSRALHDLLQIASAPATPHGGRSASGPTSAEGDAPTSA